MGDASDKPFSYVSHAINPFCATGKSLKKCVREVRQYLSLSIRIKFTSFIHSCDPSGYVYKFRSDLFLKLLSRQKFREVVGTIAIATHTPIQ